MDYSKVSRVVNEYKIMFQNCKQLTTVLKLDDEFTKAELERLKKTVWNARKMQIAQSEMTSEEAVLFEQKLFELIEKQ